MSSDNPPEVIIEQNIEADTQSIEENGTQKKPKKQQLQESLVQIFQIIRAMFRWSTIRVMLSHHPYCDTFEEHTFKIGKLRLCRGCWLSYPPMYATILIFLFWPQAKEFLTANALWFDNLWWFVIGFSILALVGRLLGRYSRFIKDLSKFGRGSWAGFLVVVIISQHWGFKIGAGLIILGGMTYLSFQRGSDMEKTCDECEWQSNFDACPGMRDINRDFASITGTDSSTQQQQSLPIPLEKPKNPETQYEESIRNTEEST
ncbi:MAG: hypothetical protein ACTSO7_15360 [Candidatus Heimdallarchaeota archaeon]